jgi:hypothetical protein
MHACMSHCSGLVKAETFSNSSLRMTGSDLSGASGRPGGARKMGAADNEQPRSSRGLVWTPFAVFSSCSTRCETT